MSTCHTLDIAELHHSNINAELRQNFSVKQANYLENSIYNWFLTIKINGKIRRFDQIFGHFQVSGKNVTMNTYRRVRSVKNF